MTRLVEIQPGTEELPAYLTVGVGDVLRFAASGGHVRDGAAVEIIGILAEGVVGTDGRVLAPAGSPSTVLFLARLPGQAEIDVVTGDPWHSPETRRMTITVEP